MPSAKAKTRRKRLGKQGRERIGSQELMRVMRARTDRIRPQPYPDIKARFSAEDMRLFSSPTPSPSVVLPAIARNTMASLSLDRHRTTALHEDVGVSSLTTRRRSRSNGPLLRMWAGPNVVWETHQVTLSKAPKFGFGIAVSGGRDSPHFASGDPSVAISDVLKAGPAEGKLQINDRIVSVNGNSLENVDHATAINVLRDCGDTVHLVVRRRILLPPTQATRQSIPYKIVLTKKNKKDDFGLVLGYKLYIAEIMGHSLAAHESALKEGDTILKINNTPVEHLSLPEARKLIEKSKEKLQLIVSKGQQDSYPSNAAVSVPQPGALAANDADFMPGQASASPSSRNKGDVNIYRPSVRSEDDLPLTEPVGGRHNVPLGAYPNSENTRYDGHYVLDNDLPVKPSRVRDGAPTTHHDDLELLPPSRREQMMRDGYYSDREDSWRRGAVEDYPVMTSRIPPQEMIDDDVFPTRPGVIHERYVDMRSDICLEPRSVVFAKDKQTGLGLRLAGGNATGIFIASVQQGSAAEREGLVEGDHILMANDKEISGLTREEAVSYLTSLMGEVTMVVQYRKEDYDGIMASHEAGDAFYIRTHFSYTASDKSTEHSFRPGTIFLVKDTLFRGMCWLAIKMSEDPGDMKKGTIPNSKNAEILKSQQKEEGDKENFPNRGRGSLFKRKSSRRSKSLGKDHWEEVVFDDENEEASLSSKFPAYERILLRDAGFVRPVVLFGAISDIARERLLADYPDRFEAPQMDKSLTSLEDKKGKSAIIRQGAIREVIARQKHCLLDVTPFHVDRLNYSQLYPIVIYLKADGKQAVKDVRSRWKTASKNPRKLLDQSERLERTYAHLFTGVLSHMGTDAWFPKLCEMIDTQQHQQIWMSEKQPSEDSNDDFMFPMTRVNSASGAESDHELPQRPRDDLDISPLQKKRLMRSNSDPSVNTQENIPGIPPYPSPPTYKNQRLPSHASGYSNTESSPRLAPDYQMHPEDRYYPSYYSDHVSSRYPSDRTHIDPYATLTPSERLRPRVQQDHFQGGYDEYGPYRERIEGAGNPPDQVTSPRQGQPLSPGGQPPGQGGPITDNSSHSSDSYSKYVSSPQNKHDDTKLREKFGHLQVSSGREKGSGHDPYRFTRSTANPVTTSVDRAKLSDLSARYRRQDNQSKQSPSKAPPPGQSEAPIKKKEPPPVPVKTFSLKQRGIESDELKMRNYENSNRAYNYSDINKSSSRVVGGVLDVTPPLPPPPAESALYPNQSELDRPYEYMSVRQAQNASGLSNNSSPHHQQQQQYHHQVQSSMSTPQYNYNNASSPNLAQPALASTPPFLNQNLQQQQHQSSPHLHQQQQQPPPPQQHHLHRGHSMNQDQRQQQFYHAGRGGSFDTAVGYHSGSAYPPPPSLPPTLNEGDFFESGKAFANEVYMDHREINRMRGGQELRVQGHLDMVREDFGSPDKGYVRPRTDDEQLQDLQRNRYRTRSETRLADISQKYPNWQHGGSSNNNITTSNNNINNSEADVSRPIIGRRDPNRSSNQNLNTDTARHPTSPPTSSSSLPQQQQQEHSAFSTFRKQATVVKQSSFNAATSLADEPFPVSRGRGSSQGQGHHVPARRSQSVGSALRPNVVAKSKVQKTIEETKKEREKEEEIDENHTVIATAKGVFTSKGGMLEAPETGVSIFIPEGALAPGVEQEIYFKVCRDNSLLPPLDTEKGETLLSPLVMCGPHGTKFLKPVELRLPHCASANPESWSFALKSSDAPTGETTEWQNMTLAGNEGVAKGKVDQSSVSILVDHF